MSVAFTDENDFCPACGVTLGDEASLDDKYRWYHFTGLVCQPLCKEERLHADNLQTVIVNINDAGETFRLSGVAADLDTPSRGEDGIKKITVPLNEGSLDEQAVDGGYPGDKVSKATEIPRATYWSSENCSVYPHGYPVHARCLDLIRYCMGSVTQRSLKSLIIALRKYWYSWSYGLEELTPMEPISRPWVPLCPLGT